MQLSVLYWQTATYSSVMKKHYIKGIFGIIIGMQSDTLTSTNIFKIILHVETELSSLMIFYCVRPITIVQSDVHMNYKEKKFQI